MRFPLLVGLCAVLLAGCGTVTRAFPTVNHTLTLLQWGLAGVPDVQTLDPALVSDPTSISMASLVYGGLVRFDAHLRVVPDGATSWDISRNGLVYTFTIRPNLRFTDGRHVTARDFADALQRALGPEGTTGAASFYLGLIAQHSSIKNGGTKTVRGIDVVDPSRLRITLLHPAAHFLSELAFPASFVPDPRLMATYGPNWTDHAAGFGPFSVQEWRHTRYLKLVRNPYYYGGRPHFQSITVHFYGDSDPVAAYKNGTLDIVSGLPAGATPPSGTLGVRRVPALALNYLAFNTTRLPFYRLNARRAFASVWSPSFADSAMGGSAFPSRGLLPSAFALPSTRWRAANSPSGYLAAARYPHARGFPTVSLVMPRDAGLHRLALDLRQAWRTRLGIDVTLRELNTSNYTKVLTARAFDLALVEWGGDYPDPQDFLGTQLGSSADNVTGWTRKPYDTAVSLADAYSPLDPRRPELFRQAVDLATTKLPILPLDEPAQTALIQRGLTHVALTPLGTIAGDWSLATLRG